MNTDFPILLSTGKCWVTLDEQDRWSKSWVTTGKKKTLLHTGISKANVVGCLGVGL